MNSFDKWIVAAFDGSGSVRYILHFLLLEYGRIFGSNIMNAEKCVVFNDPTSECPMLVTNTDPVMIRLSQSSTSYWAQTIYQLSHEMCHYAIRQGKTNKDYTLSWLEETICEAMSLYMLQYSAENWYKCLLSQRAPQFSKSIIAYLANELKRIPKNSLSLCQTMEDLRACNQNATDERDGRLRERNALYRVISEFPEESYLFCDMYRYLNEDELTVDFEQWLADSPSEIVRCLSQIQPKLYPVIEQGEPIPFRKRNEL